MATPLLKKLLKKHLFLIIIIVFALTIRIVGVVPGFNNHHPDEGIAYASAVKMILNGNLNPQRFDYPSGVPLIHFFLYNIFILPFILVKLFLSDPNIIFEILGGTSYFFNKFQLAIFGSSYLYALFWSRYITAILGAATVFVIYILGKRLFDKTTGLVAAFFLAVNYRHVLASHLSLTDVPNALFLLLAMISCYFLLKKNGIKQYMLTGLILGLYFSIKYQIFPVFTFLFVHLYRAFKAKKPAMIIRKELFLTFFLMVGVFTLLNIYLIFNLNKAFDDITATLVRYNSGINKLHYYPLYYLFYWGITPYPFIVIIAGIFWSLRRSFVNALFLLSCIIPFFYIFLYYMWGGIYVRNFTTIIPVLMIFAGYFFSVVYARLQKKLGIKIGAYALILLIIFVNYEPIKNSITLSINYLRPWNRDILIRWARDNLPKGSKVANDNIGLEYDAEYIANKSITLMPWDQKKQSSISELQEENIDFLVINLFWNYNLLFWWFDLPKEQLLKHPYLPYEILDNTHQGLALSEFIDQTIYEAYKPWQAAEYNYLVVKIPPKIDDPGKKIKTFSLTNGLEGWQQKGFLTIDNRKTGTIKATWDSTNGNISDGSLVISGHIGLDNTTRLSSPPIPIKPGKVYSAVGFIKTLDSLPILERDGFFRLDFYANLSAAKGEQRGIKTIVSPRAFGSKDWIKSVASTTAPSNSSYLTISFQRRFKSNDTSRRQKEKIWADDITLFESDEEIKEKYKLLPYIQASVPKNILYPNSIL